MRVGDRKTEILLEPLSKRPLASLQGDPLHESLNLSRVLHVVGFNVLTAPKMPVVVSKFAPSALDLSASLVRVSILAVAANVLPGGLHTHVVEFVFRMKG